MSNLPNEPHHGQATFDKRIKKIVFSAEQIETRTAELAQWINQTYAKSKDLILVALLKGSISFLALLMKSITVDHAIDFIVTSSYSGQTKSSGNIKIVMDLYADIKGKDVLIVEDIVDSGITLQKIKENLLTRGPKSLQIMTLLDKPYKRKSALTVDISGFQAPDEFLVGFGLDVKEKLRNLPYIGVFDEKYLDEV